MTPARKMTMFDLLVADGLQGDRGRVPERQRDRLRLRPPARRAATRSPTTSTISVLTQAREDLIERSVHSRWSAYHRANIHLYNALAPLFRRVVFRASNDEIKDIAVRGTELVMKHVENYLDATVHRLRVQPRDLHLAPSCRSRSRCARRSPTSGSPRTAGRSSSTCRPRSRCRRPTCTPTRSSGSAASSPGASTPRSACTPTTTAGTAVAATELAMMAGADRVEGCLFGHGERTGNVCLVTLGMNLFSQGIDPHDRLLRHRRGPAHGRVLHPAAGAPAAPVRRRPRLHRVLRLPPGRDQEGPGGPRAAGRASRASRSAARLGGAVPPDRPEGRRPHLRGRDPGQQPVRQGRRRLHPQGRAQARPAAPRADRVQPGRPGAHRRRGRRDDGRRRSGRSSRPSTSTARRR